MSKEIAKKIIERGSDIGRLSESIQLAENYLALEAENRRLQQILKNIANPIIALQKMAEKEGAKLDSLMAMSVISAGLLSQWAEQALYTQE